MSPKFAVLALLVFQNMMLAVLMKLSRLGGGDGPMFSGPVLVVVCEVVKSVASVGLLAWEKGSTAAALGDLRLHTLQAPRSMLLMSVPALLYTLQNNLQVVAISNLDAATFQVTYQLKLLTTALFSVLMLGRSLSFRKWFSLGLVTMGVALVQVEASGARGSSVAARGDPMTGLTAVVVACCCSGLAGVWFEKQLKGHKTSLWVRNVQLGIFGFLSGLYACWVKDGEQIAEHGAFAGWNRLVVMVAVVQSSGGLLTALVVKYGDNIVKGFATSISIVLSCLVSVPMFGFSLTVLFAFGASLVVYACWLYSQPEAASSPAAAPAAAPASPVPKV